MRILVLFWINNTANPYIRLHVSDINNSQIFQVVILRMFIQLIHYLMLQYALLLIFFSIQDFCLSTYLYQLRATTMYVIYF